MARKKSTELIDSEISKIKSDMARLQDRYDKLAEKLKVLQEQKWQQEAATNHGCLSEKRKKSGRDNDVFGTLN